MEEVAVALVASAASMEGSESALEPEVALDLEAGAAPEIVRPVAAPASWAVAESVLELALVSAPEAEAGTALLFHRAL